MVKLTISNLNRVKSHNIESIGIEESKEIKKPTLILKDQILEEEE